MAELGASFCLAAAQSGHLGLRPREKNSLKTGLAAAVLQMGGRDKREALPKTTTKVKDSTLP